MNIEYINIDKIKPYDKNPRINDKAVKYVAESIDQFGFKSPIIVDKDYVIICGHTRWKASQQLGMLAVPCIVVKDLTDEQVKAYRIADNKVGEIAEWDIDLLSEQLDRTCYMMEYDPYYVDVIIARWEEFTGKKAEKIC